VAVGSPWPWPPFPASCPFRLPIPSALPPPLTDPDVQNSRIRLFDSWTCAGHLDRSAPAGPESPGVGSCPGCRIPECMNTNSGLLRASSATRRSRVEMSPEPKVSDILPSFGSMNRHPLPSPGSLRVAVPRFRRYYGMLRPPDTRPLPLVALRKGTAPSAEISGSPGFLGDPVACMPRPSIPAESSGSGHSIPGCSLPRLEPRRLPRQTCFRDCIPAACMLPVYASCPRGHATLGSGCWPTIAGRGFQPAGSR